MGRRSRHLRNTVFRLHRRRKFDHLRRLPIDLDRLVFAEFLAIEPYTTLTISFIAFAPSSDRRHTKLKPYVGRTNEDFDFVVDSEVMLPDPPEVLVLFFEFRFICTREVGFDLA